MHQDEIISRMNKKSNIETYFRPLPISSTLSVPCQEYVSDHGLHQPYGCTCLALATTAATATSTTRSHKRRHKHQQQQPGDDRSNDCDRRCQSDGQSNRVHSPIHILPTGASVDHKHRRIGTAPERKPREFNAGGSVCQPQFGRIHNDHSEQYGCRSIN